MKNLPNSSGLLTEQRNNITQIAHAQKKKHAFEDYIDFVLNKKK
jgi:hypothetical protein